MNGAQGRSFPVIHADRSRTSLCSAICVHPCTNTRHRCIRAQWNRTTDTLEKRSESFQPGTCIEKSERFMKKQIKAIPEFANEQEESLFWEQNDSSDYVDWSKASPVILPNLKPTTETISLPYLSTCWIPSRRRHTHVMFPTSR